MRDRLPPLFCLQAFEAAARLGNFTRAAAELHLTPGAVSRQLRQLEDWCGQTLFERRGGSMVLTPEARALLDRLHGPLSALHEAVFPKHNPTRPTLQIATLSSLARAWLVPRLPSFLAAEPGVRLVVQTEYSLVRPPPRLALVALRHGLPGDAASRVLFEDRLLAVASPSVAQRLGRDAACWPTALMLSHVDSEAPSWLLEAGVSDEPEGPAFNDAGVMLDATVAGLGIAVTRLSIAQPSLESGALVVAHPLVLTPARCNLMVVRDDSAALPVVRAFTRWVHEQAARTAAEMHEFDNPSHRLRVGHG